MLERGLEVEEDVGIYRGEAVDDKQNLKVLN